MKIIPRMAAIALATVPLAACGRPETHSGADNQILCRPDTGEAFYSRPGSGRISFVTRVNSADYLCKQTPTTEAVR